MLSVALFVGLTAAIAGAAPPVSVLTVCNGPDEPTTLDPFRIFSEKSYTVIQQMLEGLVAIDRSGSVEPCLATTWWRTEPCELRFTLRPGVSFHDGSPMTCDDVVFSIGNYLAADGAFPARAYFAIIESVAAADPHTVVIRTRAPDSLLERRLSLLKIVPKARYRSMGATAFGKAPIGTGPFAFETWKTGSSISMTAFSDGWRPRSPKLDRLVFTFLDNQQQVEKLLAGDIDLLLDGGGPQTSRIMRHQGLTMVKVAGHFAFTASFNNERPFFSALEARRAVNLSIDRHDMIKYVAGGFGRICATMTMPGEVGHNPDLVPYPTDLAQAEKLVAAVSRGKPVTLSILAKFNAKRYVHFLRTSLQRIGIRSSVTYCSDAEFLDLARTRRSEFDMNVGACCDPLGHASFVQSIVLFSDSPFSFYRDPTYDERYLEASALLDHDAHVKAFQALDAYIHANALSLFTFQKVLLVVYRNGLSFAPDPSGMPQFFDTAWLDEKRVTP